MDVIKLNVIGVVKAFQVNVIYIYLIGCIYNIISKILSNWPKRIFHNIIDLTQSTFTRVNGYWTCNNYQLVSEADKTQN